MPTEVFVFMRTSLCVLAAISVAASASAALPQLKFVKRINLQGDFNTVINNTLVPDKPVGEQPSDVLYDAATDTLYVAGLKNSSGQGSVGAFRILNPLGTAGRLPFAVVANQQGDGCESRLVSDGTNVYLGTGFGISLGISGGAGGYGFYDSPDVNTTFTATPGNTVAGVRKYGLTGTQDLAFGNGGGTSNDSNDPLSGVLNAVEVNRPGNAFTSVVGPNCLNGMFIDTFSPTKLCFVGYGRGLVFRQKLSDGDNIGQGNFFHNPTSSNAYRDVVQNSAGDLFYVKNNVLATEKRVTDTSVAATEIIATLGTVIATRHQVLHYVPAGSNYSQFLVCNNRDETSNNDGSGGYYFGLIDPAVRNGSLTDVTKVFAPSSIQKYTNARFAFTNATIGGKDYLIVMNCGGNQNLDFYELGQFATVSGTLNLNGWNGSARTNAGTFTAEIRSGSSVVDTVSFTVANDGTYSFQTSATGAVTLHIAGPHWLAKNVNATLALGTNAVNASLVNGDVFADNAVDASDYFALSDAYDTFRGDNAFNESADLNGDDAVDASDYFILSDAYDLIGDN